MPDKEDRGRVYFIVSGMTSALAFKAARKRLF